LCYFFGEAAEIRSQIIQKKYLVRTLKDIATGSLYERERGEGGEGREKYEREGDRNEDRKENRVYDTYTIRVSQSGFQRARRGGTRGKQRGSSSGMRGGEGGTKRTARNGENQLSVS